MSSFKLLKIPGTEWEAEVDFENNVAYVWFDAPGNTYVDYDEGACDDLAHPIKRLEGDAIVGLFLPDLQAALNHGRKDAEEQEKEIALLLFADRYWPAGHPRPVAPA